MATRTPENYSDRVARLFERQGFTVREQDSQLHAEQEGTTFLLLPCREENAARIEETIKGIDTDHRTIIFTPSIPSEEKNRLEETYNVEISVFNPYEEVTTPVPDNMPSSYEIIGTVAILNFDEIPDNHQELVDALQERHPNVETVLVKTGSLHGEYRVGDYTIIGGDGTETVHREHGCRYRVDPTEVYFSERLGHERERIADTVKDGEHVHVWFAGVGPYAVLIARENEVTVDAIEKNPAGCQYMKDNIELNNVQESVTAHCGDVKDIVPDLKDPDRILMPLPGQADSFIDLAVKKIASGGVIHYYRFSDEENLWEPRIQEIADAAERAGRSITVLEREICGHRSPSTYRICLDVRVD